MSFSDCVMHVGDTTVPKSGPVKPWADESVVAAVC